MMLPVKLSQRFAHSPTRGHVVQFLYNGYRVMAIVLLPDGRFDTYELRNIVYHDEE